MKNKNEKNQVIQIRCSENEKEFIKQKASLHSSNVSEFILNRTIYPEQTNKKRLLDLCYQINKIGTNLNQAVYLCNKKRQIDNELLEKIKITNALLEQILKEQNRDN